MVIFSTCFKTDHFSEGENDRKRGRHKREAERKKKKYEKKQKKKLAHTRYKASPDLCVCVCVFESVRCGQAVASSVCTQFYQELCDGADGLDTLQKAELDPSHCESTESTTT